MGQGNSKNPRGISHEVAQEALPEVDQQDSPKTDNGSDSSVSAMYATPSFGSKIFQLFSSTNAENSSAGQSRSSAGQSRSSTIGLKSSYAPSSPLPPSSSSLAKAYRKEFAEASPAHQKKVNSFFLGKVLISPRRPLREGGRIKPAVSPLVTASSSLLASQNDSRADSERVSNFDLPPLKSVKRKATAPDYDIRSKIRKSEKTASPALKTSTDFVARTMQVEEQEEEDIIPQNIAITTVSTDTNNDQQNQLSGYEISGNIVANIESNDFHSDLNGDANDVTHQKDTVLVGQDVPFGRISPIEELAQCSPSRNTRVDDSALCAPYTPSQQPKSLVSVMDISLSSMISCASPAASVISVLQRQNTTSDRDDLSDVTLDDIQNNSVIENKKISASHQLSSGADTESLTRSDALEIGKSARENCTEDSGDESITNVTINGQHTEEEHVQSLDQSSKKCGKENANDCFFNAKMDISTSEKSADDSHRSSASKSANSLQNSASAQDDDYLLQTLLPKSHTTDCSTVSRQKTKSECKVTESKEGEKKESTGKTSESDQVFTNGDNNDDSEISEEEDKPDSNCTDEEAKSDGEKTRTGTPTSFFYHHPSAESTFSSSMSKLKWPSLSMLSPSSMSLPILSFNFISSLMSKNSADDQNKNNGGTTKDPSESSVNNESSKATTNGGDDLEPDAINLQANGKEEYAASESDAEKSKISKSTEQEDSCQISEAEKQSSDPAKLSPELRKQSPTTAALSDTSTEITDSLPNTDSAKNSSYVDVTPDKQMRTVDAKASASAVKSSIIEPGSSSKRSDRTNSPAEQNNTPKRSRRIASRRMPSTDKSVDITPNKNTSDSLNSDVTTPLKNSSEVMPNSCKRRRQRSPSTESSTSNKDSDDIIYNTPTKPISTTKKVKRNVDTSNADILTKETVNGEESIDISDETSTVSENALSSQKGADSASPQAKGDEVSVRSPDKPVSRKKKSLAEKVAILREDCSAEYIRNSQVLILVRPLPNSSGSCILAQQLRLCFPDGFFVTSFNQQTNRKNKRGRNDSLRQVERCIMEGRSPIIVEVDLSTAAVPYLMLAHSANYNTVLLQDALFAVSPRKNIRPILPYCYSWFLNLTDSLELNKIAKQMFLRLLDIEHFRRDMCVRTKHQGDLEDLLSTYISNNTVGGPEILHCTAKGGASSDTEYFSKAAIAESLGSVTSLDIVGFVITPRTFGARVRLSDQQMLLWGNSDTPKIPSEIKDMFEEQNKISGEFDELAEKISDKVASYDTSSVTEIDDDAQYPTSQLYKKTQTSLEVSPQDQKVFLPTSGHGSRAHITLGCYTRAVHPRTTGFDLLQAIEKESISCENNRDSTKRDDTDEERTTVEESDLESEMEISNRDEEQSNNTNNELAGDTIKNTDNIISANDETEHTTVNSEINYAASNINVTSNSGIEPTTDISNDKLKALNSDGNNIEMSSNEVNVKGINVRSINSNSEGDDDCLHLVISGTDDDTEDSDNGNAAAKKSGSVDKTVGYSIEGATVRCYGNGVWVVYPHNCYRLTAMFSGFHNNN